MPLTGLANGILTKAPGLGVLRSTGSFDPRSTTSGVLIANWDAFKLSSLADGVGVSSWGSSLVTAPVAAQSTGAKQPLKQTVNGLPLARFDGANHSLAVSNLTSTPAADFTIFAVHNPAIATGTSRYFFDTSAGRVILGQFTPTANQFGYYDGAWHNTGLQIPDVRLESYVLKSTGASVYRNSVLVASDTYTQKAIGNGGTTALGSSNAGTANYYQGDIYQFLIYRGALSASDRARVESWLRARWGGISARTAINTPTYDGSGQATHPSVYYNAAGWNGYKYWMAMTPYPNGNSVYENPSILQSQDGNIWTVPAGLTNPVIPQPGTANVYNSDPDLLLGPDNKLYMFYREANGNDNTARILVTSSADGVTWGAPAEILNGHVNKYLSPAVVYDGSQWVLWAVDLTRSTTGTLIRLTCATPTGTWSAASDCTLTAPANKKLWHQETRLFNGTYYCLMDGMDIAQNTNGQLYWYTSADGITWAPGYLLMDTGGANAWDNNLYRSTMWPNAMGGFDIWYSAFSAAGTRLTGKTSR